jgi:MAF protein
MSLPVLLLASGSPRRRHLLSICGFAFRVYPVPVDEEAHPDEPPDAYVLRLAESKARAARVFARADELVLAADTTVADENLILGKPSGADEAFEMLMRLRGRRHAVHTALALLSPLDEALATDLCSTDVPMRAYSSQEVTDYVASGDPLDKAGAYAIQHPAFRPVESLSGCYASVMGLPLCHLARTLLRLGHHPPVGVSQACQANLNYSCPIYPAVLRGEKTG